jgi:hypothetical protein
VTATFVFGQDIDLAVKWVCGDGWFAQHLAALDVFALGAAQQDADVVACLTLVEQFAATPVQMVFCVSAIPISISSPTLTIPRSTRTGHTCRGRNGEHVFHGHQEGTVHGALWHGMWVSRASAS